MSELNSRTKSLLLVVFILPILLLLITKNNFIPQYTPSKYTKIDTLNYSRKIGLINLDSLLVLIHKVESRDHNFNVQIDSTSNDSILFSLPRRDSTILISKFFEGFGFGVETLDTLKVKRYHNLKNNRIGFKLKKVLINDRNRFVEGPYIIPVSLWSATL